MNILVTGGLGVNGVWVTRQLFEQGHKPVVYENRWDTSLLPDIADKIEIVIGDVLDFATLIRTLKEHKIECITHLAALMPGQAQANPLLGFRVNALGTVNILETARIIGIKRIVYTSSKAVFAPITGEHGHPTYKLIDEDYPKQPLPSILVYGAAKVASELMGLNYAQNYGLEFIALRFSTIYAMGKKVRHGPIAVHSKMIENAMLGKPTKISRGGDQKDDMIYIKDVAHSIILACFAQNLRHNVFNIGTGKACRLEDLANAIKKIYPDAIFDIGPGLDYIGFGPIYGIFDISRAKEELGYTPQFTLEEGVKDYIETMKYLKISPTYVP